MGEVYRAVDTDLKRRVAIKVCRRASPAILIVHPFSARREVLAALNHPGIAAIYGLERSGWI
jgi:hypothetical protein